jgi:hypothetical protein
VRAYPTFTPDLLALADWLQACQIDTAAVESTGVYWIPIYELLDARGLKCFLVNAAHLKRVPRRKSDVQDCQWLQQCHSFDLLARSFRPDSELSPAAVHLCAPTKRRFSLQNASFRLAHPVSYLFGMPFSALLISLVTLAQKPFLSNPLLAAQPV